MNLKPPDSLGRFFCFLTERSEAVLIFFRSPKKSETFREEAPLVPTANGSKRLVADKVLVVALRCVRQEFVLDLCEICFLPKKRFSAPAHQVSRTVLSIMAIIFKNIQ